MCHSKSSASQLSRPSTSTVVVCFVRFIASALSCYTVIPSVWPSCPPGFSPFAVQSASGGLSLSRLVLPPAPPKISVRSVCLHSTAGVLEPCSCRCRPSYHSERYVLVIVGRILFDHLPLPHPCVSSRSDVIITSVMEFSNPGRLYVGVFPVLATTRSRLTAISSSNRPRLFISVMPHSTDPSLRSPTPTTSPGRSLIPSSRSAIFRSNSAAVQLGVREMLT